MINVANHPNCRVDPRGAAFFLATDQSQQKYAQKSGNGKNSRQNRHSVSSIAQSASQPVGRNGVNNKFKNQQSKKENNRIESNTTISTVLNEESGVDATNEKK